MSTKRNLNINKTILEKGIAAEKKSEMLNKLLWDSYLVLDHGTVEERLSMLEKLESHFNKYGRPQ